MINQVNKKLLIGLILAVMVIGTGNWAEAAEKSYYYESIKVDIQVNQDSTFEVIEEQTYRLTGSFGYFYRDIELKDLDHLSDIEVFDGQGGKLNEDEYELSYKGNQRHIQWNFPRRNFNNELKSWTVKYKVHGGLGFYDDYDEFYWNAIFSDRDVEVANAEVVVHLPESAQIKQVRLFIGRLASKTDFSSYQIIDNQTVRFWGSNIKPSQFMTVVVTWPKGIVNQPFLERNQVINWLALLFALALPIFVFVKMYRRWKKSGKDPKIDKTIIAQYEPPEDLAPAVVGILIDQKFDIKEVTATVIDLAVKGHLRIKEGEKKFFGKREYFFEKLKKDERDLESFERKILQRLFTTIGSKELSITLLKNIFKPQKIKEHLKNLETTERKIISSNDLKNKFYRHLPKIKKELHKAVTKTDYVTDNIQEVRKKSQIPYIILVVLAFISFMVSLAIASGWIGFVGVWGLLISIGLFIAGMIGLIFAYYMPALTKQGAEEKWKWLGFKEYLHTAERFRLGAETVETFSKYLPYAIIFEVEKEWANRFADLKYEQPGWYAPVAVYTGRGGAMSSFSGLSSSISSFTSSISKTFGSAPGGSGAGGGAGGGGGGGGGGAG